MNRAGAPLDTGQIIKPTHIWIAVLVLLCVLLGPMLLLPYPLNLLPFVLLGGTVFLYTAFRQPYVGLFIYLFIFFFRPYEQFPSALSLRKNSGDCRPDDSGCPLDRQESQHTFRQARLGGRRHSDRRRRVGAQLHRDGRPDHVVQRLVRFLQDLPGLFFHASDRQQQDQARGDYLAVYPVQRLSDRHDHVQLSHRPLPHEHGDRTRAGYCRRRPVRASELGSQQRRARHAVRLLLLPALPQSGGQDASGRDHGA